MNDILSISNPDKVKQNINRFIGSNVPLYLSTRKNKKYMLQNPKGTWIHFGSNMEDYTKHADTTRLKNFRTRNAKWKDAPKWSPSWLSYYLLWS